MAQKAEIQYVGQFYVFGSEAPQPKPQVKKPRVKLPALHLERLQKVYIDPVALGGVVIALVMLVLLIAGAYQLRDTRAAYDEMKAQLSSLKRENASLSHAYHTSYSLEDIRQQAEKIGMVEGENVDRFTVFFALPKEEKKPFAWDDFVWFLSGLFSEPKRGGVE